MDKNGLNTRSRTGVSILVGNRRTTMQDIAMAREKTTTYSEKVPGALNDTEDATR